MTDVEGNRGAWPADGDGGTLRRDRRTGATSPGPYYTLSSDPEKLIGLGVARSKANPIRFAPTPTTDDDAVYHGVMGIQLLAGRYLGRSVPVTGVYDRSLDQAVRLVQGRVGLTMDGLVGARTMKAMLFQPIKSGATSRSVDFKAVWGLLANEGAWDPGAIGTHDPLDRGLAQINARWHASVSFAQAFCPSYAIGFVCDYLVLALSLLEGNLRDAIASYNLGIGGARQWIAAGRPEFWTPPESTVTDRPVWAYIDRILGAYDAEHG